MFKKIDSTMNVSMQSMYQSIQVYEGTHSVYFYFTIYIVEGTAIDIKCLYINIHIVNTYL